MVSRPPKRVKKAVSKTPVHELAEELGLPVLIPPSAKAAFSAFHGEIAQDQAFLEELEALKPDARSSGSESEITQVCVTAAWP